MKNIKKIFFMVILTFISITTISMNVKAADVQVSDFDSLRNNLKIGNNITLEEDINFSSAITLNVNKTGDVLLDLNGHDLVCNSSISTAMLTISNSSNRYTANIKIIDSQNKGTASHGFINSESNKANSNASCRAIQFMSSSISGKITLEIDGIKIDGFKTSGLGAAMNIQAVAIQNEEKYPDITIKNSTITNNTAGNAGGALNLGKVNATLENNNISYNTSSRDGGALNIMYSNIIMKNNVIEHNKADSGGGVYIVTNSNYARSTALKILFENNKINYNSGVLGGGLNLTLGENDNVDIKINSGEFIGNTAEEGGAIYHGVVWSTNKNNNDDTTKTIYLKKALITGNQAARGGGVWLCPQAYMVVHTTLGGAIYGNTAIGSFSNTQSGLLNATGDDIRYEGNDGNDKQYSYYPRSIVTVSDRTWSGQLVNWYKDEETARYNDGIHVIADKSYYTDATNSFSLHGIVENEESEATLIIKNNIATQRGGGIFTNNLIIIGEDEDISLTVSKEFRKFSNVDDQRVLVNLVRVDADGKKVILDKNVELNKDNSFTHTFVDLPSKYLAADGSVKEYKYEVEEVDKTYLVEEESGCTKDDDGNYTCKIVNEYVEPTEHTLEIEKTISGNTPKVEEEFTFELKTENEEGLKLPNNTQITIKGSGRSSFDKITFLKAGTYTFTIKELIGDNSNYKYDLSTYIIQIVVVEKDGKLSIESVNITRDGEETEKIIFENVYISTTLETEIEKQVEGNPPSDSEFNFELNAEEQEGLVLPDETTVSITGSGTATFGEVTFTEAGTYTFTVQELLGEDKQYTYDSSLWTITVEVEKNEKGALKIKSVIYNKNDEIKDNIVFKNTYNPTIPSVPDLGDNISYYINILITSGCLLFGAVWALRKRFE